MEMKSRTGSASQVLKWLERSPGKQRKEVAAAVGRGDVSSRDLFFNINFPFTIFFFCLGPDKSSFQPYHLKKNLFMKDTIRHQESNVCMCSYLTDD